MFIQVETIIDRRAINVNHITFVRESGDKVDVYFTDFCSRDSITLNYTYDEFMEKLERCSQPF